MAKELDPLEAFIQRRAAERLARIVTPERAPEMRQERKQAAVPVEVPAVKREEPTQMKYTPAKMGLQMGPDANRAAFQVPRETRRPAVLTPPGPPPESPTRPKVDPLQAFIAQREAAGLKRAPSERLGRSIKLGM